MKELQNRGTPAQKEPGGVIVSTSKFSASSAGHIPKSRCSHMAAESSSHSHDEVISALEVFVI